MFLNQKHLTSFIIGATPGTGGYGIRDNAGAIEMKNSGGTWQEAPVLSSPNTRINNTNNLSAGDCGKWSTQVNLFSLVLETKAVCV